MGLVHTVRHRSTWSIADKSYLNDLFVAPPARGRGVGRRLIEYVYAAAAEAGCQSVYWLTHETNATAMELYDRIGRRSGFVQYSGVLSLGMAPIRHIRTPVLDIAYEAHGPEDGDPVVLLHGFPYDPRCFDDVASPLAGEGYRVIVPYLRGYGPTRFLSGATPRSGQQAALARDLLDLLDALGVPSAALMGYDWGGRAACVVAALWPGRVRALVTGDGYNIQNIARSGVPVAPWHEHQLWYQYYFHSERGRAGLAAHRAELAKLLWRLWSPQLGVR